MEPQSNSQLRLTSPVFADNAAIPAKYTCRGQNISPPLVISGVPNSTKSLVLILHDPDAPSGDFVHWVVWNIPPGTTAIAEGALPSGAKLGMTSFGKTAYGGPCPPSGMHHYIFELFALRSALDLPAGANRDELLKAMNRSEERL
jgi:Raf kinase inhibitor-like YbhB/YbcL family protein